jgi:hypothetical protein
MQLLGVLPLLFFIAQGVHYWLTKELGNMFWMCNLGNLILALGLFFEKPAVIRLATIWTIPGLIIWFLYVVLTWGVFPTSTLAHVGGLAVAAVAIKTYRMDRRSWSYAFGWYLAVQLISRFFTAPALNVNLAHSIQPGWERAFSSYWLFWLILTITTAASLWLSGLLWRTLCPTAESSTRAAISSF